MSSRLSLPDTPSQLNSDMRVHQKHHRSNAVFSSVQNPPLLNSVACTFNCFVQILLIRIPNGAQLMESTEVAEGRLMSSLIRLWAPTLGLVWAPCHLFIPDLSTLSVQSLVKEWVTLTSLSLASKGGSERCETGTSSFTWLPGLLRPQLLKFTVRNTEVPTVPTSQTRRPTSYHDFTFTIFFPQKKKDTWSSAGEKVLHSMGSGSLELSGTTSSNCSVGLY